MSSDDNDLDLRERFRELRAHDDAHVPAFENVLRRAQPKTPHLPRRLTWATGGAGLVVIAIWLAMRPPTPALDADAIALTTWSSPTDILLASPDDSLLRLDWVPAATPEFGRLDLKLQ